MVSRTPRWLGHSRRPQLDLENGAAIGRSPYTHILVPNYLGEQDSAALVLGAKLAVLHRARFTVLNINSQSENTSSLHWLDAIDRLFQCLDRRREGADRCERDSNERIRSRVWKIIYPELAESMLSKLEIHIESLTGNFREQVARYADQQAVDLLVMSYAPVPWWSFQVPAPIRQVLRGAGPQVILIGPDDRKK